MPKTSATAVAIGAVAVGAFAVGALAIRWLMIRNLRVHRATFDSLEIKELTVGRLRAADVVVSGSLRVPYGSNHGA